MAVITAEGRARGAALHGDFQAVDVRRRVEQGGKQLRLARPELDATLQNEDESFAAGDFEGVAGVMAEMGVVDHQPDPAERAAFAHDLREAYGPLDEAQLLRARVLALSLCAALAGHARAEGVAEVEREALAGLARALDEGQLI